MTSMTYGTVPNLATIRARLDGGTFTYKLGRTDAAALTRADIHGHWEPQAELNAEQLHDLLRDLKIAWMEGDEGAGELASSMLQAINIEWI